MNVLEVKNIGPIKHAKVEFGDLTILVGPQASGKSVFLQMLKLALDKQQIVSKLTTAGTNVAESFLDVYLGAGMGRSQSGDTSVAFQGQTVPLDARETDSTGRFEKLFYIPSHRSVCYTRDGWIRAFSDFTASDPFAVRDFSEEIRQLLDIGLSRQRVIYPDPNDELFAAQENLSKAILAGFDLKLDEGSAQRRLILSKSNGPERLTVLSWSAGQREFVPLLLGLMSCLPGHNAPLPFSWLVVEEPELGLHPDGIMAVMAVILEMLSLGINVCISTHSVHVLDLAWALRVLGEQETPPENLLRVLYMAT